MLCEKILNRKGHEPNVHVTSSFFDTNSGGIFTYMIQKVKMSENLLLKGQHQKHRNLQ